MLTSYSIFSLRNFINYQNLRRVWRARGAKRVGNSERKRAYLKRIQQLKLSIGRFKYTKLLSNLVEKWNQNQ